MILYHQTTFVWDEIIHGLLSTDRLCLCAMSIKSHGALRNVIVVCVLVNKLQTPPLIDFSAWKHDFSVNAPGEHDFFATPPHFPIPRGTLMCFHEKDNPPPGATTARFTVVWVIVKAEGTSPPSPSPRLSVAPFLRPTNLWNFPKRCDQMCLLVLACEGASPGNHTSLQPLPQRFTHS